MIPTAEQVATSLGLDLDNILDIYVLGSQVYQAEGHIPKDWSGILVISES
jgi:hypothetical protein